MKRAGSISMLTLVLCLLPICAGAGVRASVSMLGGAGFSGSQGPGGAVALAVLAEPAPAMSIGLEIGSQYFRAPKPVLFLAPLSNTTQVDGINRDAAFFIGPTMRANFAGSSGQIYVVSSIGYQSWTNRGDFGYQRRGSGKQGSFGVGLERNGRLAPAVEVRWRGLQSAPEALASSISVAGGIHFR